MAETDFEKPSFDSNLFESFDIVASWTDGTVRDAYSALAKLSVPLPNIVQRYAPDHAPFYNAVFQLFVIYHKLVLAIIEKRSELSPGEYDHYTTTVKALYVTVHAYIGRLGRAAFPRWLKADDTSNRHLISKTDEVKVAKFIRSLVEVPHQRVQHAKHPPREGRFDFSLYTGERKVITGGSGGLSDATRARLMKKLNQRKEAAEKK